MIRIRRWQSRILVVAAVTAGCGTSSPAVTATPTSRPAISATPVITATPSPSPPVSWVIAVENSQDGSILLVRDDGTVLATFKPTDTVAHTAAAGRFWYVLRDGQLHSVTPDGIDTDVATLQDGANAAGLAVSPDGRQWAWGISSEGTSPRVHVDVGGLGLPTRTALDAPSSGGDEQVVAWTSVGVLVGQFGEGGGCCYIPPEELARGAMLLDPATLQVSQSWPGCATAAATDAGSFACVEVFRTGKLTVHEAAGVTTSVTAEMPAQAVGWAHVDDSRNRVVFGVIHSLSGGYRVDTEAGDLATGAVTTLWTQVVPDALLPDGRVVVTSVPLASTDARAVYVRSETGASHQIGPVDSFFLAAFTATPTSAASQSAVTEAQAISVAQAVYRPEPSGGTCDDGGPNGPSHYDACPFTAELKARFGNEAPTGEFTAGPPCQASCSVPLLCE